VILSRIRSALGSDGAAVSIPRDYRRSPGPRPERPVELFATRVDDYRATVSRVGEAGLAATIARLVGESVAVPGDLPAGWLTDVDPATLRTDDPPLEVGDLDRISTVVTACAAGIAETGTIVLDGGAGQGRRVLSLVPDHHVVVIHADQVVAGVPDVMGRLRRAAPQTWVSGPSATSDIELNRVEGVHGPRHLDVVIVEGP
jgi:L-lactate dehydrogenase complex protein LldG